MATAGETETKNEKEIESQEAMEDDKEHKALFDQPLIQEGKRKRKSTDMFSYSGMGKVRKESTGEGTTSGGGSGIKLKDAPFIDHQISKHRPDELKQLHKLCFERPGSKLEIKRNLRTFNGWDFAEDSSAYKQKVNYLEKLEASALKLLCDVLDIQFSDEKDDTIKSLLEFFMCPKDSGRPVPVERRTSSSGRASKKSKTSESDADDVKDEDGGDDKPNGEANDDAMETSQNKEGEESGVSQVEEEKQEQQDEPKSDDQPQVENSEQADESKDDDTPAKTVDEEAGKQEVEA